MIPKAQTLKNRSSFNLNKINNLNGVQQREVSSSIKKDKSHVNVLPSIAENEELTTDFSLPRAAPSCVFYRPISTNSIFLASNYPTIREISRRQKENLAYYPLNRPYEKNNFYKRIRLAFSLPRHNKLILKSINTIQLLMNSGFLYPRIVDVIKAKLFTVLIEGDFFQNCQIHCIAMNRQDIMTFIDEVVQLARYQPAIFAIYGETKSIKELKIFFGFKKNQKDYDDYFRASERLNNEKPFRELNLAFVELGCFVTQFSKPKFIKLGRKIRGTTSTLKRKSVPLPIPPTSELFSAGIKYRF